MAVKGLERLNAKLKALRTRTAEAVKPAVAEAAEVVTAMQKNLVPVEHGKLRSSITWAFASDAIAAGGGFKGRAGSNETRAVIRAGGRQARYAPFVEFGTKTHPKQPFFFPGYRATRKTAKAIITRGVKEAILRAVR